MVRIDSKTTNFPNMAYNPRFLNSVGNGFGNAKEYDIQTAFDGILCRSDNRQSLLFDILIDFVLDFGGSARALVEIFNPEIYFELDIFGVQGVYHDFRIFLGDYIRML